MAEQPSKSLARSLGEFFGHIWHGVKADPAGQRRVMKHEVEEQTTPTPEGQVTLRRTTIEEIEIRQQQ